MRNQLLTGIALLLCATAPADARGSDQQAQMVRGLRQRLHRALERQVPQLPVSPAHTHVRISRSRSLADGRTELRFTGGNAQSGYLSGISGRAIAETRSRSNGSTATRIRAFELTDAAWLRAARARD